MVEVEGLERIGGHLLQTERGNRKEYDGWMGLG